jgi:hypothetical protein
MTQGNHDGRPCCEVRDRTGDGPVLRVSPLLYRVLRPVIEKRMCCTVELSFNSGGLGGTHIRLDGERFVEVDKK